MNLRTAAVPLAALVLNAPLSALAQGDAVEGKVISDVRINGVKNTNATAALAATTLKAGSVFTNEAFEADKRRIRDVGLYSSVSGRTEVQGGKLIVIYDVVEYPVISNIVITGNEAIETKDLQELIRVKPGQVLNTVVLDQDVQKIQRFYADRGYVAFVSDNIGIDPKTNVLTVPIIETVVESIQVTGNRKTKPYVVLREMKTKPGEPFNRRALQRDLSRVYSLGLFEDIGPVDIQPGSELGKTVLTVPVQERRTGQVAVGFGYSTRQRLVGRLELSETNFRGRGQAVSFLWEVGGASSRNSFEIGFTEPWLDRRNTSLSVNLYDRVLYRFNRSFSADVTQGQDDDPYFERRRGGASTLSRPFSDTTRGYVTLRTEAIKANNLEVNLGALTDEQINDIRGSLVQNGEVTSATLRSATNTRDNDLDPASGFFFSPSVEIGTASFDYRKPFVNPAYVSPEVTPGVNRVLFDERTQRGGFTKYNLDLRSYVSLSGPREPGNITQPKRVLAGRLLFGFASGNIGFSEQYFLGGAETLRGYPDDRFWGNRFFLASAELRLPLDNKGTITGVLFTDVGDAWGASEENQEDIPDFAQHNGFRPNVGVGLGVRLKTPIGPVRLDYGYSKEGGRTHFSIGQAF